MDDGLILFVDDKPWNADLFAGVLRRCGYSNEIVTVGDGEEALDYLFARGAYTERDVGVQPRLVLLDLALPRMGGLDVLRRLRQDERTRLLRVVAISSSDQARDVDEVYRAGANSYIHKPTDPARFADAVRVIVRFWLTINEPPPEGGMGHRGRGETFRGLWFRPPLIDRRKVRRTAVLVGVVAWFLAHQPRTRKK